MSSSKSKITIKNLSKSFRDSKLKVLDNISLTVNSGELVSIIGPSGSGKSTLLDCVAGLSSYDKGEITIAGGTAYMFQDDVLFPWRTVLDNVIVPLELTGKTKQEARNEVKPLLKLFGLDSFAQYYPFMLSGGMRERASLLRTYVMKKDVMLLDEPFSKLDALNRQRIQEWFLQILAQQQKTVLFVTHDIDEAIFLSDRIFVLSERPGKILAEISVSHKKPRTVDISTTKEFIAIKKKILQILFHEK